ncbi:DUF2927 domain-containing protein [Pseudorhodobacter sp.]|uniref:DUF2927 domain-containing protein n=1 Tax=Pseudorhodobacter sp. TaxID=1934400 RepID=UPI0026490A38|nr:DUF2927 domain-containing protein [Pseudorhodobacter sp.]MDN5788458.1 DUF2927 domain-containing protein [Pseudorhodobacter sp.]
MRVASLLAIFLLSACVPAPDADVSMNQTKASITVGDQANSQMNRFGLTAAPRPTRSNASIARDFLELTFNMESGRPLPVLTRFEGPITVKVAGPVPGNAATDLARVLARFRNEAGIDVRQVASGPASINIEFVPRNVIRTTYANVACFVVPRVASWAEFQASRRTGALDWATLASRETASVFIPADAAAQEVRDCLNEETAQAMGPLNDLYRLTDSVFNDDNFNSILTGFDMTVLRAYYAPELRSGMTQAEVAAKLPAVLARVNPAGERAGSGAPMPTPRIWINAVLTALGGNGSAGQRESAARQALGLAHSQGWTGARLAFSQYALGRLIMARDPSAALAAFNDASRIYRGLPGGAIYSAHVDMQLAAYALSHGDPAQALQIAERSMPVIAAAENASLMATMMLVKAEALAAQGHSREADAVRMDSRSWARYGFGSDAQINARAAEISALARRGNKS